MRQTERKKEQTGKILSQIKSGKGGNEKKERT
jgi:hypothetical protein